MVRWRTWHASRRHERRAVAAQVDPINSVLESHEYQLYDGAQGAQQPRMGNIVDVWRGFVLTGRFSFDDQQPSFGRIRRVNRAP